ncbi:MAG: NAD(+) diphosphatase [Beijerinckiaceae bacterium]|nr:NAD(+) diphosphatase [Beijerinckiaceae bacterium]
MPDGLPPFTPAELSTHTGFAVNPLDRLSNRRDDAAFIDELAAAPSSRFVVIAQDRPVLKKTADGYEALFTRAEAQAVGPVRECVLLGVRGDVAYFGQQLDDSAVTIIDVADEGGMIDTRQFVIHGRDDLFVHDLRPMAIEGTMEPEIYGLLGEAKSLLYWHRRHRFCSNCGEPSQFAGGGWRRQCDACKGLHFPRTDPVVIMLATHKGDVLLGRQPRFNKGMYSALAGFLEPGESVEDAVRREIHEESGIRIGRVAYMASQPWPFPASLMIGCIGEALNREIVIDKTELEDCRWFSHTDIVQMFERNHPQGYMAPHHLAIAHHILRAWRDGEAPGFG